VAIESMIKTFLKVINYLYFMNVLLLGYSGIRNPIGEFIASRYDLRHLSLESLSSAYKEIFFGDHNSSRKIPDDSRMLLKIAELYRGDHLVFDGVPNSIKVARSLDKIMQSFGRCIDYVFLLGSKLEDAVSAMVNGNPDERERIRLGLIEEKDKIITICRYYLSKHSRAYLLKGEGKNIENLEGEVLDLLEHNP